MQLHKTIRPQLGHLPKAFRVIPLPLVLSAVKEYRGAIVFGAWLGIALPMLAGLGLGDWQWWAFVITTSILAAWWGSTKNQTI